MAINSTPGLNKPVAFREALSTEDRLANIETRLLKMEKAQQAQADINVGTAGTLSQIVVKAWSIDQLTPLGDLIEAIKISLNIVPAKDETLQNLKRLRDFNGKQIHPLDDLIPSNIAHSIR